MIRELFNLQETDSIPGLVDGFLEDFSEIVKSRVEGVGGNCLLGYKIDICRMVQVDETQLYMVITATGDAVLLEDEDKEVKKADEQ